MSTAIQQAFATDQTRSLERQAQELFAELLQPDQYVGEVFSLGYDAALVQIHDFNRRRVGGIPSLCFLVATRIPLNRPIDPHAEDTSVVLLRVMDQAPLPDDAEAIRRRAEAAQRASGTDDHWDRNMDPHTHNLFSYAGVRCSVIGTFFLEPRSDDSSKALTLRFGSDISNYYPNEGLKVYKPNGRALARIANYRDPALLIERSSRPIAVGTVRYASTSRAFQGVSDVPVELSPEDLLAQKTALFGMTRTGKSNTTKVILQAVFNLRFTDGGRRIGQIVFDPNGEYANENVQDAVLGQNPTAIRNVWRSHNAGKEADVVTYGLTKPKSDLTRKLMLLNFYEDSNLQIGKEIIDNVLASATSIYLTSFRQLQFIKPVDYDTERSAKTRYDRRVLAYRALLARAGFERGPKGQETVAPPVLKGLFNDKLITAMRSSTGKNSANYQTAANILERDRATWDQVALAMEYLNAFITEKDSGYAAFNNAYMKESSTGDPWADSDMTKILGMFGYAGGPKLIGEASAMHTGSTEGDYAEAIYKDLAVGRLVIVDQSGGEEQVNRASATRIMDYVFRANQRLFREAKSPPDVLVYVEEAHNILPAGSDLDLRDIWVRTAKEGAKYRLGLVYATQEVSSIQRNILKNTANWFIGHLNNTDETKELGKYYDFADFLPSIRRAADRGFLRVKTLSNPYVIPAQIKRFEVQ